MSLDIGQTVHAVKAVLRVNCVRRPFFQNLSVIIFIQVSDMHRSQIRDRRLKIIEGVVHNHFASVGNFSTELLLKCKLLRPRPRSGVSRLRSRLSSIGSVIALTAQHSVVEQSKPPCHFAVSPVNVRSAGDFSPLRRGTHRKKSRLIRAFQKLRRQLLHRLLIRIKRPVHLPPVADKQSLQRKDAVLVSL